MKKIRKVWEACYEHRFWLLILLCTDLFFSLFLWLLDIDSFGKITGLMLLGFFFLFFMTVYFLCRKERERELLIMKFLDHPDSVHEMDACRITSRREQRQIREIGIRLREKESARREQMTRLGDYEEYIEAWTHEVKTPLSLMTLMLDNRREEMAPEVYKRLEHARNHMQGYVEQILYYARLKAEHKDYLFEKVSLSECCEEVLADYRMFFQEQGVQVTTEVSGIEAVTDKKGLCFILRQVISNSIKYQKPDEPNPVLLLKAEPDERSNRMVFTVQDNGIGIKAYELPFIFDKGFTGDPGQQKKKSTGMGLYLVKQMADDLNIGIVVSSEYQKGLEISFQFPIVV